MLLCLKVNKFYTKLCKLIIHQSINQQQQLVDGYRDHTEINNKTR